MHTVAELRIAADTTSPLQSLIRHTGRFISFWDATCLQCFDAVGWAAERAPGLQKTEWWGAGVVICLKPGADLHMAQLMPLPLGCLLPVWCRPI